MLMPYKSEGWLERGMEEEEGGREMEEEEEEEEGGERGGEAECAYPGLIHKLSSICGASLRRIRYV